MFDNEKLGMRAGQGAPRLNSSSSKPKISLRSVRSLPHSSPSPSPSYALLLYHIDNYAPHEPGCQQYQELASTLGSIERTTSFRSAHELKSKISGTGKTLILTGTNQLSQQTLKQAGPLGDCDMVFLGELHPGRQLLDPSVVMAANEGAPLLAFIRSHGFDCEELQQEEVRLSRRHSISSTDFRNLMHKIMREDSEYSSNNNIFRSTFRSNSPTLPKTTLHWTVDHDPSSATKFATRLLPTSSSRMPHPSDFSPTVSPFSSTQPNWREAARKQEPLSSSSTERFYYEGKKEEKTEEEAKQSGQGEEKTVIQPMFWYEKKQLLPSKIINEVSQEYQLSKRSSLIDPQRPNQLESIRLGKNRLLDNSLQLNSNLAKQSSLPEPGLPLSINSTYKSPRILKKNISETPQVVREETLNKNTAQADLHTANQKEERDIQIDTKKEERDLRKTENPIISRTVQRHMGQGPAFKANSPRELKGRSPKSIQASPQPSGKELKKDNHIQTATAKKNIISDSAQKSITSTPHVGVKRLHQNKTQTGSSQQVSSPDSKAKQVIPAAFHHSLAKQFEGFERIEKDGVIIYRRKNDQQHHQAALKLHQGPATINPQQDSTSLKPQAFEHFSKPQELKLSPERQQKPFKNTLEVKKHFGVRPGANESMTMSRLSELHSDGSILRRNNMRFGVKVKEKPEVSMMWQESRLVSGLGMGGKAEGQVRELSRLLVGEEVLDTQRHKCSHIVTSINNFHFLVHDELSYLVPLIKQLLSPNDVLEVFTSFDDLFEFLGEKVEGRFDGGFIFTLPSHIALVNPKMLPEDYLVSVIDPSQGPILELSPGARRLRIDHLKRLLLAETLLLENKLYQYVLYRSAKPEIKKLAEMLGTELIAEKVEGNWKADILDNYFGDFPRLTRLYFLLEEQQLDEVARQVSLYQATAPAFLPSTCKLLCVLTNILPHDELILSHPTVTFLNNPEDLSSPMQVLHYAHYHQEPSPALSLDYLHYPHQLSHIPAKLQTAFPGRFEFGQYRRVGEAIQKGGKGKGAQYLLLGEGSGLEKVGPCFRRVFALGKGGIQSSMVRVLNLEELIEKLRYY